LLHKELDAPRRKALPSPHGEHTGCHETEPDHAAFFGNAHFEILNQDFFTDQCWEKHLIEVIRMIM
jgi:hypothetical protein